jgi:misacylated tRNA(Ala) deacylase
VTELLYLDDAYLREFDATVVAVDSGAVARGRTAFYPGGGGQPADTGRLNAARATRVFKDEHGMVWHQIEDLERVGTALRGRSIGSASTC